MSTDRTLDEVAATSTLATKQLAALRAAVADSAVAGTLLTDLAVQDGVASLGLAGGAAQLLAEALTKQFADSGAVNYVELTFRSTRVRPGQRFVVTLQRCEGKTPHELRRAAEAEVVRLRQRLGGQAGQVDYQQRGQ